MLLCKPASDAHLLQLCNLHQPAWHYTARSLLTAESLLATCSAASAILIANL